MVVVARFSGFKFKISPRSFSTNQAYDSPILVTQSDFSSGVNNSVLQTAVNQEKEFYYSENLYTDIKSQLKTRPAFVKHTTLEDATSSEFGVQGVGMHSDKILFAYNGKVYSCDEYLAEDEVSMVIHKRGNNVTELGECAVNQKVQFLPFHKYTYILDGGRLKRYSVDEGYEDVPNAPYARFGIVYKNRLWVAGNEGTFNYEEGEEEELCHAYGLYVCGPNDGEDWGKHGLKLGTFFEIDPYDVTTTEFPNRISGLELYGEAILVFKTGIHSRIYRVDGATTDTFQISKVHEGSTCVNPFTVTATPIGVMYLSHDGIRVISDQTQPAELASSKLSTVTINSLLKPEVEAAYDFSTGNYIISADREVWAFNVYTRGWFYWVPPSRLSCVRRLESGLYFGSKLGSMLCLNKEEFREYNDDNQTLSIITSVLETAAYSFGQMSITKYIKNCYALLEVPYSAFLKFEFKSSRPQLQGVGSINQYSIHEAEGEAYVEEPLLWDNPNFIWDYEMPDTVNDYVQIRYGFDTIPDDEIGTTGWEPNYTINDTEYAKQFNKAYSVMKPDELFNPTPYDQEVPTEYIKYRLAKAHKRYLTEFFSKVKTITAFYNNPDFAWDHTRFIWDSDMRYTAAEYVKKMYGYDEAKKDFSDVFYGWDIGMPPPDESVFKEWYDERIRYAKGIFGIGKSSDAIQFDSNSLWTNIVHLKMPVGLRDTNVTFRLTVTGSPIVIQEITFDGSLLRPAP